jgi:hypothetical protein
MLLQSLRTEISAAIINKQLQGGLPDDRIANN